MLHLFINKQVLLCKSFILSVFSNIVFCNKLFWSPYLRTIVWILMKLDFSWQFKSIWYFSKRCFFNWKLDSQLLGAKCYLCGVWPNHSMLWPVIVMVMKDPDKEMNVYHSELTILRSSSGNIAKWPNLPVKHICCRLMLACKLIRIDSN